MQSNFPYYINFIALTCNCSALHGIQTDPLSESRIEKPHPVYVPRDETFEEIKQNTFSAGRLKALLHNLLPSLAATLSSSDIPFKAFSDIDDLYNDGVLIKEEEQKEGKKLFLGSMVKEVLTVGERWLKYEIPAVIKSKSTSSPSILKYFPLVLSLISFLSPVV